jgi:hypothetical protein
VRQRSALEGYQEVGGTRRKGDAGHSTRCRYPTRNRLPANAACASREATFLIKVKSHRGEPINQQSDTLAEEGREISNDDKRWDDRTDRMMFEVQKKNTTARSVWTNSVRNAFRKQAGWAKLQETRATATKQWTERVWYRHNQRWMDQGRMGRPATRTWSTLYGLPPPRRV